MLCCRGGKGALYARILVYIFFCIIVFVYMYVQVEKEPYTPTEKLSSYCETLVVCVSVTCLKIPTPTPSCFECIVNGGQTHERGLVHECLLFI